ncbi:MAG TPA: hypothetical protein DCM28_09340 [Phycisphaerales bacterium]|nr:hypothetical protein [Phycisphaerales bacterium]HCD34288.1 hypothetical protein [Phycisphaerales bacterium]|tara:strand:+ start:4871 stop:5596 length:726 start_codon:yes stop_codon:yes gene_type:complete
MSWQLLDDLEILYRLKESTVTCRRGLFLNDPNKPPQTTVDIQAFYKMSNLERIDTPYPIKLEIHAYDTTPLAAAVIDANNQKLFGCYVWDGSGGSITNASDQRLILLADYLHAYIYNDEQPDPAEYNSEETCSCCGDVYQSSRPDGGAAVEMQLNDNSRSEGHEIQQSEFMTMIGQYATEEQIRSFFHAISKDYTPTGELHFVRVKGQGNHESLMISVMNSEKKRMYVFPDGSIDVFAELG